MMFGDLLLLLVLVDLDILFVFIDDYSRYSWIFPMKSRSEILPIYSNFANVSKLFDLIMLLNILNMRFKFCYIPMALYII